MRDLNERAILCAMLTAQKQAFVDHFAAHQDGPAAYRHAYNVRTTTSAKSISTAASKLLSDPEIVSAIEAVRNAALLTAPVTFTVADALAKWIEIAQADPRELIGLRVGCCRYCHGEGGGYQWHEREYLAACDAAERDKTPLPDPAGGFGFNHTLDPNPDCWKCRGEGVERIVPRDTSRLTPSALLLYGGVKQKRDGVEIIIADRMKALENACRIIGAYQDRVKLDGSIGAMAAIVQQMPDDPKAAARAYQELMAQVGV